MKVTQSCPTLCDPMDYTVCGILQTRILAWVAFPFSRGSSQPRDQTQVSCTAGRFFTSWATREARTLGYSQQLYRGGKWGLESPASSGTPRSKGTAQWLKPSNNLVQTHALIRATLSAEIIRVSYLRWSWPALFFSFMSIRLCPDDN